MEEKGWEAGEERRERWEGRRRKGKREEKQAGELYIEKTGRKKFPAASFLDAGGTAQVALGKEGLYLWLQRELLSLL